MKFNFLNDIPISSQDEIFQTVLQNENIKIERIISYGQISPKGFWYDQEEDEFLLILDGDATIEYDDGNTYDLIKGDSLYINAHQKHRVTFTSNPCIWLAVFIKK